MARRAAARTGQYQQLAQAAASDTDLTKQPEDRPSSGGVAQAQQDDPMGVATGRRVAQLEQENATLRRQVKALQEAAAATADPSAVSDLVTGPVHDTPSSDQIKSFAHEPQRTASRRQTKAEAFTSSALQSGEFFVALRLSATSTPTSTV